VFVLGVALGLSVLNVYFRDLQHLIGVLLQVWFYATPIIYPIALVKGSVSPWWFRVYQLNPMVWFVESYHRLLYDLRAPTLTSWIAMIASSVVTLFVGLLLFRRFEGRLAEEL
jgi:ABC-2 type transport system permease protein